MSSGAEVAAAFGVVGHRSAARLVSLGLRALRDRDVGGAAVLVSDGAALRPATEGGPRGPLAIGACAGADCAGPTLLRGRSGAVAVGWVGALTNGAALRADLLASGATSTSDGDAEVLAALVARSERRTFVNRLVDALFHLEGGFAAVVASEDTVVAVRDPWGIRTLWVGRIDSAPVVGSDHAALVHLGAVGLREVEAGEVVVLDARGASSVHPMPPRPESPCALELIAMTGSDGAAFGRRAWDVRVALGARLAQPPVDADVVLGVPGAGQVIAAGYAAARGLPHLPAFVAVPDAEGLPDHAVVRAAVAHKRVVVVAALIAGDAVAAAVRRVRAAGADAVHVRAVGRVAVRCVYGVRTEPSREGRERWEGALSADSVGTLTCSEIVEVLRLEGRGRQPAAACTGCLGGPWPIAPTEPNQLDLF